MTRILIRCDASLSIGSGHVMRCRNLARMLKQRGAEVSFICRKQPGDLIHLLENEVSVLKLPEQSLLDCKGLQERQLYAAWLGCSQEQDAVDCLNALTQANISTASWLVVDHYGLDAQWEVQLQRTAYLQESCTQANRDTLGQLVELSAHLVVREVARLSTNT